MLKKLSIFLLFVFTIPSYPQEQPNILWVTIEDTSPEFIGAYGNGNARTPNIDKLASEGVIFKNAFSTGTVCSPSRTALITGVKTFKTGTGNHRTKYAIPDFIKGFPYYLKELGYYTSNNFKTDYNVSNGKEFIKEAWHESSNEAGWWNRNHGQPFFSVFNFMESHQSRTMTKSYDWYLEHVLNEIPEKERIKESEFDIPPFYEDNEPMRKQFARVYNSIKLVDIRIGELLSRLEADGLRDDTIIFLFADHGEGIPRGKTNGIDLGYRVPFIVWFPEKYIRLMPFEKNESVVKKLIDFCDLAPTMIELGGGSVPEHMDGHNFLERRSGKELLFLSSDRSDNGVDMVRSVTDGKWLYSRNYMPYMPEARYIRYMEIGEIKQQMRLDLAAGTLDSLQQSIFDLRPPEFLFDLINDPWETNNLANDQEQKEILNEMRKALKQNILDSRDIHFLPEFELRKISQTTVAYNFRLNPKFYDLEKIYEAATLSGFRTQKSAKKQISFLEDENEVVRYWAIMGLKNQNKEILKDYEIELKQLLNDSYEPVVIIAAGIVYEIFQDKNSEHILNEYVKNPNPDLALMTINNLLYLDEKSPFIDSIKEVVSIPGRNYDVHAACMDFLGSLGLVPNSSEYEN